MDAGAHAPRAILGSMVTLTDDLVTDYGVLTDGCGLLDRSERGKLALTGSGAREFLAGQVTNDIVRLQDGSGCYAAFLTPKGKMLGDLRVLAVGEPDPELLLDTDRPTLQALFDMIRRFKIGYDVELHKRTVERGLLSLAGPAARRVAGAEDLPEEEHAHAAGEIGGRPVRLVATDAGIDVLCDAADTEAVRAALLHAGAEPVSEDAAEILRVERGRPRYGAELDDSTIPQEAGLNERAVSFTKGCYVGQETVARLFYRGKPNRHLRGLRLSEPVASGAELRLGERVVGRLASSLVSPAYGPIALALVRREASVGDTVDVEGGASCGGRRPPVCLSARLSRDERLEDTTGRHRRQRQRRRVVRRQPRLRDARLGDRVGRQVRAAGTQRRERPRVEVARVLQHAPVGDPPADEPERVEARRSRVRREHEPRPRVGRRERAVERAHERRDARAPAAQPGRALVALLGGGRAHLRVEVLDERRAAVALAAEERERLVEAAAVDVRVEVVEARRHAAPHLPVGRRPRPQAQLAAAVAQAEERVELLLELDGGRAAAQRADRDRPSGGRLARDLEDRIGDVEAAAQVDEGVVALVDDVAGRAQLADEPVFEEQRAELGVRRAMVDDRRLLGPALVRRRRREVRPRPRAQRDRLADVEDLAGRVSHDVDAGFVGHARGRRRGALRRAAGEGAARPRPRAAAGRIQRGERLGHRPRLGAEAAEERAEDARARLGVGERAVRRLDLDPERVGERREAPLADERREPPRERDRAERRRVRPAQVRPRERLREDAAVERGVVGDEDAGGRASDELGEVGQRRLRRRGGVDHRLRDLREALDRARQRRDPGDERLPAVVQLAAADEHGPDLRELAGLTREAVGLGVDGEELGRGQRLREQIHRLKPCASGRRDAGRVAAIVHTPTARGGSLQHQQSVVELGV